MHGEQYREHQHSHLLYYARLEEALTNPSNLEIINAVWDESLFNKNTSFLSLRPVMVFIQNAIEEKGWMKHLSTRERMDLIRDIRKYVAWKIWEYKRKHNMIKEARFTQTNPVGYVVLIRDIPSGLITIGFTYNPIARLENLQKAYQTRMKILATKAGISSTADKYCDDYYPFEIKKDWYRLNYQMIQDWSLDDSLLQD